MSFFETIYDRATLHSQRQLLMSTAHKFRPEWPAIATVLRTTVHKR